MTSGPSSTEDQLVELLGTLAGGVHPAPDAYQRVRREWRRRARRRRLTLAILFSIVFAVADVVGIWALNQAPDKPLVIFNDPTPTPTMPTEQFPALPH